MNPRLSNVQSGRSGFGGKSDVLLDSTKGTVYPTEQTKVKLTGVKGWDLQHVDSQGQHAQGLRNVVWIWKTNKTDSHFVFLFLTCLQSSNTHFMWENYLYKYFILQFVGIL